MLVTGEKLMLKRLSAWLHRISHGWVSLSTLILFILFIAFVLPREASTAKVDTGNDRSPDMSLFYSANDLYEIAQAYGEQGRVAYIKARFTFDLIWPLVYMVFLTTTISWVYHHKFKPGSYWQLANLVPVFGMLFDYLENIATSTVMARYPTPTIVVDQLAPIFTLLKWVFIGGSFILLLIGLVVGILKWMRAKYKSK
jgi:hypothetical protein